MWDQEGGKNRKPKIQQQNVTRKLLLGLVLTWKARARILLAAGTSLASHLDLAPISHRTSALGQWATALCRRASKDSLKGVNGGTDAVGIIMTIKAETTRLWSKWQSDNYETTETNRRKQIWSPGAVVLLKIRCSKPNTFLARKHLQGMGINGPGTL